MRAGTARVEVYKRADGLWAWRYIAPNGKVTATDGSQGYENRADAIEQAAQVTEVPITVVGDEQ